MTSIDLQIRPSFTTLKKGLIGYMPLGARLTELRRMFGLRQEDIAKKLGLSRATYAMYEQDRRDPDTQTLVKLSKIFDVSTDYLLTGMTIGEQISRARVSKGLSIEELSQLAGLKTKWLESLETSHKEWVVLEPEPLARLALAVSDDPVSFLLKTAQRWRYKALELIASNGGVREVVDPKTGAVLSGEELEFVHAIKDQVAPGFFYDFHRSRDRQAWIRSLRLLYEMMKERDFELESMEDQVYDKKDDSDDTHE